MPQLAYNYATSVTLLVLLDSIITFNFNEGCDGCTKVGISIVLYGCRVWLLSWVGIAIWNGSTFIYH